MRILAFTIGQHYLGLPADQIGSVGKRGLAAGKKGKKGEASALDCDLAAAMNVAVNASDRVISCSLNGRSINLFVEKIIGLVDLEDGALSRWPSILDSIPLFSGVGVTDTVTYLLLDLKKVGNLKGGE